MALIGNQAATTYQNIPDVQRFNGDGSDTTFTLNRTISNVQDILVSVDGVIQDTAAYSIPDGTTLTFTEAPSTGTGNIFVNFLGFSEGSIVPPDANKGNFRLGGMFRINAQTVDVNTTINANENANVTGPITIGSGVTLTVNSGGHLAVI